MAQDLCFRHLSQARGFHHRSMAAMFGLVLGVIGSLP